MVMGDQWESSKAQDVEEVKYILQRDLLKTKLSKSPMIKLKCEL